MTRRVIIDRAAMLAIEADCKNGGIDLPFALAWVGLRAASLAASVTGGMTVPKFLDLLDAEIRGWKPPEADD